MTSRPELWLRDASAADSERLFGWANDPLVRQQSFSTAPIPWEDHQRWFASRLADPHTLLLVAELGDEGPVGYARFELKDGDAVISVALGSEARGRGLGAHLIRKATEEALSRVAPGAVRAYVKADNSASLQAFTRAGYGAPCQAERAGAPVVLLTYAPDP